MAFLLGLEHENEYDPRVRDELEQLVAGIQTGVEQFGRWVSAPLSSADFRGSSGMTWTVTQGGDSFSLQYSQFGKLMHVAVLMTGTSVGGTLANALRMRIPGDFRTVPGKVFGGAFHYTDNGTRGTGAWLADGRESTGGSRFELEFYKQDVSNWNASTNNTLVIASCTFEVQ